MDSLDTYAHARDFHDFYIMTDTELALDFEGITHHEDYFSEKHWEMAESLSKFYLTNTLRKDARDLLISRMMRRPLS
jgi:hypothetical protein